MSLNTLYQATLADPRLNFCRNSSLENPDVMVIGNEFDRWAMDVKEPSRDNIQRLFVAVGTNMAWDLAYRRRASHLHFVDTSLDVLMMHTQFYAPLIEISQSPADFLCHLSGLPEERDISLVFDQIETKSKVQTKALHRTENALKSRDVADDRCEFILQFIENRSCQQSPNPFEKLKNSIPLPEIFLFLYDLRRVAREFKADEALLRKREWGFLNHEPSFHHVRELYLNNKVSFAHASIFDPSVYQYLSVFLKAKKLCLSDFYISNILDLNRDGPIAGLQKIPRELWASDAILIQTRNVDLPHSYCIHTLSPART